MEFSAKLAQILERRNLKAGDVAKAAGCSASSMSRWLSGEAEIALKNAAKLAKALDVPIAYLADDDQDELPPPEVSPDEAALLKYIRAARIAVDDAVEAIHHYPKIKADLVARRVQAMRPIGKESFDGPAEPERKEKGKARAGGKTRRDPA